MVICTVCLELPLQVKVARLSLIRVRQERETRIVYIVSLPVILPVCPVVQCRMVGASSFFKMDGIILKLLGLFPSALLISTPWLDLVISTQPMVILLPFLFYFA